MLSKIFGRSYKDLSWLGHFRTLKGSSKRTGRMWNFRVVNQFRGIGSWMQDAITWHGLKGIPNRFLKFYWTTIASWEGGSIPIVLQNLFNNKVADLSPIHFRKQAATDGTKLDLNIGETRVWRLDSGPNLQSWTRIQVVLVCFISLIW